MPLRSMLTPAQQQAAEERFAERVKRSNATRAALGKAPKDLRGPFDAPPTQAQKDAIAATKFAENNADRVSRGLDPRLSGDEKVVAGNAKAVAKGMAPKPYTTKAGKEAYNSQPRPTGLMGAKRLAKGGSVTSAPKRAKSGVTRGDGCAIRGKTKGRFV